MTLVTLDDNKASTDMEPDSAVVKLMCPLKAKAKHGSHKATEPSSVPMPGIRGEEVILRPT